MNLKSILTAAFLLVFAANAPAFANEEHHTGDKSDKAEAAKSEKAETKKPVKKHSHQQEKGITPAESTATPKDPESMKDMHDHTKDRH